MELNEMEEMPQQIPQPAKPEAQEEKKQTSALTIAGIVLSAALVLAIGVCIAIYAGVWSGNAGKVARAFVNTYSEQPLIMQDFAALSEVMEDGEYTASFQFSGEDTDWNLDFMVDGDRKQFSGAMGKTNSVEFAGALTEDEILFNLPFAGDYVFYYRYRENASGYLPRMMGEEKVASLNRSLKILYDPTAYYEENGRTFYESRDAWLEAAADYIGEIEFQKVEPRTFEIRLSESGLQENDPQKVECKGYQTTLSREKIEDILDLLKNDSDTDDDMSAALLDALGKFSELNLTFYLYDEQLAAIVVGNGKGDELCILYQGGDRRTQNMSVCLQHGDTNGLTEKTTLLEITGDITDSTETIELYFKEGMREFYEVTADFTKLTYDSETGAYEVSLDNINSNTTNTFSFYMRGTIAFDRLEFTVQIDRCQIINADRSTGDDGYSIIKIEEGTISVTKGAVMQEIDGERFDLGNAGEDEWSALIGEVLYGF